MREEEEDRGTSGREKDSGRERERGGCKWIKEGESILNRHLFISDYKITTLPVHMKSSIKR